MKKFLTSALAMLLTLSCVAPPSAFAADHSTKVEYTADTQEEFLLTVPASLEAGKSGDVTLEGKWPSNKTFTVSADKTVTMNCDIGGSQVLNVTFAGIELAGSNTVEVSETKQVSVDSMNALFGEWSGTFRYNLNGTNSDTGIDWSDATDFTVTKANRGAVGYTDEITDLDIPEHFVGDGDNGTVDDEKYEVVAIGDDAFADCTTLETVNLPSTVASIGDGAFSGCTNLTEVTTSSDVNNVVDSAYNNCPNLTSAPGFGTSDWTDAVEFTVTSDNRAAVGYTGVENEELVIPMYFIGDGNNGTTNGIKYKVTSISKNAFCNCANLASVIIPGSVTIIEGFAFCRTGLTSVAIPKGVTRIGERTFYDCPKLTSISISESVTSIEEYAFFDCRLLTAINVDVNNSAYKSIDGVLFTNDGKTLIQYPPSKTDTTYAVPDGVIIIEGHAFYRCTNLTSITIPNSVTSISDCAFANCTNLTSVTIPKDVTSIENNTFYGCASLTNVTIPSSVTSIDINAFAACTNLTSITFTGTKAQWNAIAKNAKWDNYGTNNYIIYCTNGNIPKS